MSERFGKRSRSSVHMPFAVVACVALAGFGWIAMRHWREGAGLVAGALLLAALLRALFSNEQVGLLGIRSRAVDILLYSGLGTLVLYLVLTIEDGPLDF